MNVNQESAFRLGVVRLMAARRANLEQLIGQLRAKGRIPRVCLYAHSTDEQESKRSLDATRAFAEQQGWQARDCYTDDCAWTDPVNRPGWGLVRRRICGGYVDGVVVLSHSAISSRDDVYERQLTWFERHVGFVALVVPETGALTEDHMDLEVDVPNTLTARGISARTFEVEFLPSLARVRHMRMILAAYLNLWDLPDLKDDALIVVSELVTNAIRHGRGLPATLRASCSTDALRIEVTDGNPAPARPRVARETDENGRGLELVDALSTEWGVSPDGMTTWCSMALPRTPPSL